MRPATCGWWGVGVLAVLLTAVPGAETLVPVHRERYAMGTMFNVIVYHGAVADAERAVDAALAEIVRLDDVMSHYKEGSDLSRLNRDARAGFVAVDPSLYDVLTRAAEFSRRSGGRFDVTIAPLLRAWKNAYASGRQASVQEIANAWRCVGYRHIETRPPNQVRFLSDCLELDLGGIGKGYAVDKAVAILERSGIRHALVNAGGSTIGAVGSPPGLDGWPVDLGARVSGHQQILLRDEAISTSQQYLRPLPFADGTFGDIIDPQRGAPTERDTKVCVVTPSATTADALSTTLLLMPVQDGKDMLANFQDLSALWMSPAGRLLDSFRSDRLKLADVH